MTLNPIIKSMSPLLLVTDLENTISFYTLYLGFEVDFRYQDFYAGLVKDKFTIHLKLGKPDKSDREERLKKEDIDFTFSISGIDEYYNAIKSTSVTITQELRDMPYGREFYIADPDGYLLSFLEVPEE